jgi:glycerol-3-phosphate acyltransferase PlsY
MLVAVVVFVGVVGVTRMVSAGSILGSTALGVAVFVFPTDDVIRGIALAIALLVVVRHRENIQRIFAGTENRLGGTKRTEPPPPR